MPSLFSNFLRSALAGCLLLGASSGKAKSPVLHVLMLQSFDRGNLILDHFTSNFRVDTEQRAGGHVNFVQLVVGPTGFVAAPGQALLDYVRSTFAVGPKPDLIVTVGGPAAVFARKYRQELFPDTPLLFAAVDQRYLRDTPLGEHEAAVTVVNDFAGMIDEILQLRPQTKQVFMVMGSGQLGRFWRQQLEEEFKRFNQRLTFTWSNDLSLSEMLGRAASLPSNSAIFYLTFGIDAQGGEYADERVLADLHAAANAPLFSPYAPVFGYGIVGGMLMSIDDLSHSTADAAVRILNGAPPATITVPPERRSKRAFDWRELQRWGITERGLPPGSAVFFRQQTLWDLNKWRILLAAALACAAAGALYYKRVSRLQAAHQAQAAITREFILSQENERKRIAGELHDGLGQDLLLIKNRVAILAASTEHSPQVVRQLDELLRTAQRTIGDIRSISQALRPVALEQVGLTKAIEWMIDQIGETSTTKFNVELEDIDGLLPPDLEINLYRIVQESLNNVIKHAQATQVRVVVKRGPGQMSVSILDNGRGFDSTDQETERSKQGRTATLGLAGMAERAKLLDGHIEIQSAQGTGTKVTLTLPLRAPVRNGVVQDALSTQAVRL